MIAATHNTNSALLVVDVCGFGVVLSTLVTSQKLPDVTTAAGSLNTNLVDHVAMVSFGTKANAMVPFPRGYGVGGEIMQNSVQVRFHTW